MLEMTYHEAVPSLVTIGVTCQARMGGALFAKKTLKLTMHFHVKRPPGAPFRQTIMILLVIIFWVYIYHSYQYAIVNTIYVSFYIFI
jgi:hypothetical protein